MNIELIKTITEDVTGMKLTDPARKKDLVTARAIYYKLARANTGKSLSVIGKLVGRDHASVLHGINSLNDWMEYDKDTAHVYDSVKNQVQSHCSVNEFNNTVAYYFEENKRLNNIILNLVESNQILRQKVYGKNHSRETGQNKKEVSDVKL